MITIGNASATHTVWRMWRRLRRRTMAPSRPLMYPEQLGLVLLSLLARWAGVYLAIRGLFAGGVGSVSGSACGSGVVGVPLWGALTDDSISRRRPGTAA